MDKKEYIFLINGICLNRDKYTPQEKNCCDYLHLEKEKREIQRSSVPIKSRVSTKWKFLQYFTNAMDFTDNWGDSGDFNRENRCFSVLLDIK